MKLAIFDPDESRLIVSTTNMAKDFKCSVRRLSSRASFARGAHYSHPLLLPNLQLNPKLNKSAWDKDGRIVLADPTKPYPVGSDNAPVARYSIQRNRQLTGDSLVCCSFNSWWCGGGSSLQTSRLFLSLVSSPAHNRPFGALGDGNCCCSLRAVNFWPNPEDGQSVVQIELTKQVCWLLVFAWLTLNCCASLLIKAKSKLQLRDIRIAIPLK
jgi:hypothetical protein